MSYERLSNLSLDSSTDLISKENIQNRQIRRIYATDKSNNYFLNIIICEFFSSLKRVLGIFFTGIVVTILALVLIGPEFKAESTLLVLLSPDYSPHAAGEDSKISSIVLERDAVLKDEVEILSSRSLAKITIQKIGLENIYPEYSESKSLYKKMISYAFWPIKFLKSIITGVKIRDIDPLEFAVTRFMKNLSALPDKSGNIIKVTFTHNDPLVASLVINTHINSYLAKRIDLYRDLQSTVLIEHVKDLAIKLDSIYDNYENFKLTNNISDYNTQRQILLNQRGEITQDLHQTERLISQNSQKSKFLQRELDLKPNDTVQYHDKLTQIRRGRPQVLDTLEVDKVRADQELVSNQARKTSASEQLSIINSHIQLLDKQESSLERIDRSRRIAEESYHTAIKALTDREMHENLMDNKTENVRVIQFAETPLNPTNLRIILFIVGVIASILLSVIFGIIFSYIRKGFICAESLEKKLHIPVLATINLQRNNLVL